MKYWLNVISREHVLLGVEGGFTQAQHGKATGLRRLSRGDGIVFYSPRTALKGDPLRRFTAIGAIADDEVYQVVMRPDFHPWRRKVIFSPAQEAAIEPLIPDLEAFPDKQRWGFPLRRGLFEISVQDFRLIAEAMKADASEYKGAGL
jgi:EVE domain